MVAKVLEVARKLAVPMRNIRGIKKMIRADVFNRLRQLRLAGFDAEVNLRFSYHARWVCL